jgi:hypothetical protein
LAFSQTPIKRIKPFISTIQQFNIANTSEILSDSFDSNVSSKVDTHPAYLSAVETKAGLVLTSRTTPTSRLTSLIHYNRLLTFATAALKMP